MLPLKYIIFACFAIIPNLLWANFSYNKDPKVILLKYVTSADNLTREFDLDQAKIYLDSASLLVKKVNAPVVQGYYYQNLGDYYNLKRNEIEAHKNYYRAIEYYEKAGQYVLLNPIYCNLVYLYYQKEDTNMMSKIISEIKLNASKPKNVSGILDWYGLTALYYNCLYEKNKSNTNCLDSVVFYETRFVKRFEADTSFQDTRGDIAFNYMLLSLSMLKLKNNTDSVNHYLEKAKQWINPVDTAMIADQHWIEGEIAFNKKQFTDSKEIFTQLLILLDSWTEKTDFSLYVDIYSRLSEIAEIEKDYQSALNYERKKTPLLNQIHDIEKYKVISDLEKKYETEKKDREIQFEGKMNRLYLGICILVLLSSFFIIRWLLSRKKASDSQLQLTQMEKNEIELQTRLKDEMLEKAKFEKYESLLAMHFKNLEISEMDDTLLGLKNEQIELNKQIEDYTKRFKQYEKKKFALAIKDPYFESIACDVCNQILKKISEKNSYLEALQVLNDNFFLNLKNTFQDDLSVINIKYCICFAIGMNAEDISKCFSIEQHSVHRIRYRLKSKFKLDKNGDKDIDFNLLLRKLNEPI